MKTTLIEYTESRPARELVSLGQQAVGDHRSEFQPTYLPARTRYNPFNRSRAGLTNAAIDDGFHQFRVF
jgi:hypothetical protein